MMIVMIGIICYMMGYIIFMLAYMFPVFRIVYLDWFATIFFILPFVFIMYRMSTTKSYLQVDKIPLWKQLMYYLRRDHEVVPLIGSRAYPGESFLDVPQLGLIEFLGRDTFYHYGDKKIVFGLENVNYTPDPRYGSLTHLFWELGFSSSDDVRNVLTGQDLYLMGKVFLRMQEWNGNHGVVKLVKELKEYDGPVVDFHEKVDRVINKDLVKK